MRREVKMGSGSAKGVSLIWAADEPQMGTDSTLKSCDHALTHQDELVNWIRFGGNCALRGLFNYQHGISRQHNKEIGHDIKIKRAL